MTSTLPKLTARELYDSDAYGFSACAFGAPSNVDYTHTRPPPPPIAKSFTMNKRIFGRTGLHLSEICLGTMNFGWSVDQHTSLRLLNQFTEAGGNFIQTAGLAPTVAREASSASLSETLVGEWLKSRHVSRHELMLATQLAAPLSHSEGSATARTLEQACDGSLKRLQADHLDLVICQWRPDIAIDELLRAMTLLVQRGKVRYFGLTGCRPWRAAESLSRAARNSWCRIEALQADYSLLERTPTTRDVLDLSCEHRVGFIARSPLAGGFLASTHGARHTALSERSRWLRSRYLNTRGEAVQRELIAIARTHHVQPASVALAWVLSNRCVTAALVGAQSSIHLNDAFTACALTLSKAELSRLTAASELSIQHCTRRPQPGHSGPRSRMNKRPATSCRSAQIFRP